MDVTVRQLLGVLWWALLIKGIATLAFGSVAVFWPGPTLIALVYAFSAFIIISGIINLTLGLVGRGASNMWLFALILGILETAAGIFAVRHPAISLAAFILFVGSVLLVRGILQIVASFMEVTPDRASKALLVVAGVLEVVVGAFILLQPITGGLAFVWAIGVFALITGSMDIARSIAARNLLDTNTRATA